MFRARDDDAVSLNRDRPVVEPKLHEQITDRGTSGDRMDLAVDSELHSDSVRRTGVLVNPESLRSGEEFGRGGARVRMQRTAY